MGDPLVSLLEQPWPVLDGAAHVSGVNEIEWLSVGPFGFDVVDFKYYVWRDPMTLSCCGYSIPCARRTTAAESG